jgi:hypothetical protein
LSVNILESELISPIFHYQTTVNYLVRDLISKHVMDLLDKEIEALKDARADEGKEDLTGLNVHINYKTENTEAFGDNFKSNRKEGYSTLWGKTRIIIKNEKGEETSRIYFLRVFAISDIHIDYNENKKWLYDLSRSDYIEDILILAGDITSKMSSIIKAFVALKKRFKEVLFIPGNHDLWINRKNNTRNSLDNFFLIKTIAGNCGIRMEPAHFGPLSIIPLYGWYDYSFGKPSEKISPSKIPFNMTDVLNLMVPLISKSSAITVVIFSSFYSF